MRHEAELKAALETRLGDGYTVEARDIQKRDGKIHRAFAVTKIGKKLGAVLYIESFEQKLDRGKMEISDVVDELYNAYLEAAAEGADPDKLMPGNKEEFLSKIRARMNYATGMQIYLQNMVTRPFLDMAVTYYYPVSIPGNNSGFVTVTKELAKLMDVTEDEMFRAAIMNEHDSFKNLDTQTMLAGMGFDMLEVDDSQPGMIVVTNDTSMFGATAFMHDEIWKGIAKKVGDFAVIPSSVHELIVPLGAQKEDIKALRQMVKEVNETQVEKEDWLSFNVYWYDSQKREFSIA